MLINDFKIKDKCYFCEIMLNFEG
ncbi:MAG: hypothetical protein K0R59_2231, partial [Sphingobacterium sp.]|nr:hypothetical protein [Sphingobacterium sp.]